jgi:outer membrane protein
MHVHSPALRGLTVGGAILLSIISPRAGHGQETPSPLLVTLDRALDLAVRQNRDLQIAEQDRFKAGAQVSEARSGALPQLSVNAIYTRNIKNPVMFIPPNTPINPSSTTMAFEVGSANAYLASASINQTLFNWRVGAAMDIANAYSDLAERSFEATQADVVLQTKKAFYTVLLMRELVRANRQGFEVVRANLENVRAQFKNGTAAEFDLLRAEVQVANTEPLMIAAENSYELTKNSLKSLLALPLDKDIEVQGELTYQELDHDRILQERRDVLASNLTIAQLSLQESLLQKNISVERAGFYPTVNLIGAYLWASQDNSFKINSYLWANSFNLALQISLSVFDGFKTSARTEQAMIEHQKSLIALQKAEEGLLQRVQSIELRMAEAKKRIAGQEKSLGQAQKAIQIAQTRFKSGVGTQLELMDTQVAMTRTQTNYAQAIYDYLVARAEWDNALGRTR